MARVEYNGGPDIYVGLSTEPKPTAAADGITEGALVIERDTQTIKIFSGSDVSGWDTFVSFA